MKKLLGGCTQLLRGRDKGTVAVTFFLSLPLLLFTLCVIIQYALIINARIVLNHATSTAARSAMVCLPTDPAVDLTTGEAFPTDPHYSEDYTDPNGVPRMDGVDCVNRAARMVLASISPSAQSDSSEASAAIADGLQVSGFAVNESFQHHYTFAEQGTTVEWEAVDASGNVLPGDQWQPLQFAQAPGQRIKLTVHYLFYLNVPGVTLWGRALTGQAGPISVAGVTGYFLPMTASCTVQLTHGREAMSDTNGNPLVPAE